MPSMEGNSDSIALYAAVKTLHKDGHDMWSAVASLTLLVVTEPAKPTDVAIAFAEKYEIAVPQDALNTILSRLKKDGLVNYTKLEVSLTEAGSKAQVSLNESVKKVKREYATLCEDFISYLKKRKAVSPETVTSAILDFIDDNIGFTSEIITAQQRKSRAKVPASDVADYIMHLERTNTSLFDLLQNIFFGRLYLSLIKTRTELDKDAKFDRLTVYLDTNVLFSILDLHDEVVCRSAKELLALLKAQKEKISVAVFEPTLDEALSVLNGHAKDPNGYVEGMKVDSVHYRLRLKQVDREDILLLIETLREKIEDLGIEIVKLPDLDQENVDKTVQGISAYAFVNDQVKAVKALDHDATAYESVRVLRGNAKTRLLEKSKAVFVTQDRSVYLQAREESLKDNTFPIAIRPVDIISLLWIKSLSTGEGTHSLLRNAVMGYARERLINHKLWDEFVQRLGTAQKKGDISKDDVGMILASDETEKLLLTNSTKVVNKIVDPMYVSQLRAKQAKIAEQASDAAKKASTLEDKLDRERKGREVIKSELDQDRSKLDILDLRVLKFASVVAFIVSLVLWLVVIIGLLILLAIALRAFGFDRVGTGVGVGAVFVTVVGALITGKVVRLNEFVIGLRNKLYDCVRNGVARFVKRRILGLKD